MFYVRAPKEYTCEQCALSMRDDGSNFFNLQHFDTFIVLLFFGTRKLHDYDTLPIFTLSHQYYGSHDLPT